MKNNFFLVKIFLFVFYCSLFFIFSYAFGFDNNQIWYQPGFAPRFGRDTSGDNTVDRFYDKEFQVVCYIANNRNLNLPPSMQCLPRTIMN